MLRNIHPCSPVEQDFIWVAEYDDNTYLTEYNFDDKKGNLFDSIDKDRLLRFGIIGLGRRFHYEVWGGTFRVDGKMYEFFFETKDKTIPLTGNQIYYNDVISYKSAEVFLNPSTLQSVRGTTITSYTFGYKVGIDRENNELQFKAQCVIPYDSPLHFNFRLVSSKSLTGDFVIRKNGKEIDRIKTSLKKNVASELNWIIQ
ncbi:hypothetical protein MKX50_15290 [Paenibacillus sp. FSL W8-0186]|uniref:Uncharacterized protein n=1 Tax=Paenibacillus woosongensis TaxID=307580 RepID=A0ABQ4MQ41_9BACL|nr:hypothetical protein [Paenibacillus woosongensis]GIP58125.1 hypothetical protein J15TS10_19390 [Paenibacillus woosongensis]